MNITTLLKRAAVYGAVVMVMLAFNVDQKLGSALKGDN